MSRLNPWRLILVFSSHNVAPLYSLEWIYLFAESVVFALNIVNFACDVRVEIVKLGVQVHNAVLKHCHKVDHLSICAYLRIARVLIVAADLLVATAFVLVVIPDLRTWYNLVSVVSSLVAVNSTDFCV